ncbi:MAG: hypothetical protein PHE73_07835 [Sulfurovaceae bacterium]|nr:hypothetical protein [Sulfurovaceae bacterium]
MYCIINQNKDIIAADQEFFSLLKLDNIMELYRKISIGDIDIAFEKEEIIIGNLGDVQIYPIKSFDVNGLLSQSKIIEILPELIKNEIKTDQNIINETISKQKENPLKNNKPIHTQKNKDLKDDFNDFDDFILEEIIFHETREISDIPQNIDQEQTAHTETQALHESEINNPNNIEQDNIHQETNIATNNDPKVSKIDIEAISQKIGLSKTDYISFLQEYLQTAKSLKNDLEGQDEETKKSAINFLMHLSDVLYLPEDISNLVALLKSDANQENIDNFYNAIDQFSSNNEISEITLENIDSKQSAIDQNESEKRDEATENENPKLKSALFIDLSGVTPVEFDFTLDEAAKKLSLPDDIVKDFIKDFIEQCHTETGNLLDSYKKGDIETAKKIARLLKRVANNLYITPLAMSLYELHSNEEIEKVEPLFKKYWAQFLSFENLIKNA